jgi:uncharacterized protein (TIGR02268 family)
VLALSSAVLLPFVLLTTPLEAGVQAPLPTCASGTRQLELMAGLPERTHEVCIRPGRSTSFFFDAKLARVELPGRERFRMLEADTGFTLMATRALPAGERVPVTVSFEDGRAPARASFVLVVHPSEVEHEVLVTRQERTLASYREGEQRALDEARQCRWENARLQVECTAQVGLTTLLSQKLMGKNGVPSRDIDNSLSGRPGNTLISSKARSYRSDMGHEEGGRKRVRLAVEQELENTGSTPWTLAGVVLVGPNGEEWKALAVWPLEPIAPGKTQRVVVEMEAPEEAVRGSFTLKLWSQEGDDEAEVFEGVTFPAPEVAPRP